MTNLAQHIPVLETANLRLRGAELRDFDAYATFRASDRAAFVGGPNTRAQAFDKLGEIVGHWSLRGYGRWIVADKSTDDALGVVGLFFPDDWPEPEIAWSVFETAEGRGVAFEAAMAAKDYAFNTLGWTTAISCVEPGNHRSAALAKRMGAVQEDDFTTVDGLHLQVYRHPRRTA